MAMKQKALLRIWQKSSGAKEMSRGVGRHGWVENNTRKNVVVWHKRFAKSNGDFSLWALEKFVLSWSSTHSIRESIAVWRGRTWNCKQISNQKNCQFDFDRSLVLWVHASHISNIQSKCDSILLPYPIIWQFSIGHERKNYVFFI